MAASSRFAQYLTVDEDDVVASSPAKVELSKSDLSLVEELVEQGLTGKQAMFCIHYVSNGFNATRAAESAGYAGDANLLGVVGHENLRNPKVRKVVNGLMAGLAMSREEVVARLAAMADGTLSTKTVIRPKGTTVSYDTRGAAELIGKTHALFRVPVEVTGKDGGPIEHDLGATTRDILLGRLRSIVSAEED